MAPPLPPTPSWSPSASASNAALARTAGLEVGRGIVVDDHLETNAAGVHAIGECAEHRGCCYGLVEPAYEQAQLLARRLAGERASYPGSVLATNLKVSGVNVFSAGDFLGALGRGGGDRAQRSRRRRLQEAGHRAGSPRRCGAVRRYRRWSLVSRSHSHGLAGRAPARRSRVRARARGAHGGANAPSPQPPAVRTTCPYCGVGCGVLAQPDGYGGAVVAGDPHHPANFGRICSKGSALGETLSLDDRVLHPMFGSSTASSRASWSVALDRVADGFNDHRSRWARTQ